MMTTDDTGRLHAAPTSRNREPILAVLRRWLPATGTVLEIASGTGEHAVFFPRMLPGVTWQPSEYAPDRMRSIAAWIASEGTDLANLRAPVRLDVTRWPWPVERADAIVNVNMIHASPWDTCLGLFEGAGRLLPPGGVVCMYGPYRVDGEHTAESNARFDQTLRRVDPAFGIRDLGEVEAVATEHGFGLAERVAMPANNFTVVFRREACV